MSSLSPRRGDYGFDAPYAPRRDAVLLMAAQHLPRGQAVGVDIWSTKDQSRNAERVTRLNAELEGVAERVELHSADMRDLP
jgi:hypothetical protein